MELEFGSYLFQIIGAENMRLDGKPCHIGLCIGRHDNGFGLVPSPAFAVEGYHDNPFAAGRNGSTRVGRNSTAAGTGYLCNDQVGLSFIHEPELEADGLPFDDLAEIVFSGAEPENRQPVISTGGLRGIRIVHNVGRYFIPLSSGWSTGGKDHRYEGQTECDQR